MASKKGKPDHLEIVGQASRKASYSPKLLKHLQRQAIESLHRLFEHMFSACDDLFYDLSKRASSNNEQNLYFDSMREIRIKKSGLIKGFTEGFTNGFEDLFTQLRPDHPQVDLESSKLSIVESDVLEVDLALSNMTSRAREAYKEPVYELTIRLDHLLLQINIDEENNPLDPRQLTKQFIETCSEHLQINIKARLILFKLFEKHILKQLGHIYSDANQLLIDAGILPKVPKQLLSKASSDSISYSESDYEMPASEAEVLGESQMPPPSQATFSLDVGTLTNLMSKAKTQNGMFIQSGLKESPHAYYLYTSNPGPVMGLPKLTALLTKSQLIVDHQLSNKHPQNIVSDIVHKLLAKKDPTAPQSLEQPDEDIINLIAMFFDKVLEDEQLPVAVQSLVCRLQIPVLKIALKDQSFLTNPDHSARKLINIITEAGQGLDESKSLERDPLYRKIADCVQTINRQYKADDSVFYSAFEEVEELLKKERRKTNIVEARTNQAEAGKSKIKHARSSAQDALYGKLKNARLPETISSFLTNTWQQVLVITYLKHGIESAEWVESENVITDLIWLCHPHTDERSKLRKRRLLPEVLQQIESGLETAIDNAETRLSKVNAVEEALDELSASSASTSAFTSLSDDQKEALGKSEPEQKSWEDMTALEKQQTKYEELSNKFYLEAKDIQEGVWIDYKDEQSGRITRCKLSAKIDPETYIFVNRIGLKVLEKSRRQFAYDMQFKRAVILDDGPVFERLMSQVVSRLSQAA